MNNNLKSRSDRTFDAIVVGTGIYRILNLYLYYKNWTL